MSTGAEMELLERALEAEAEVKKLRAVLSKASSALSNAFAAGMEEREGGSGRRQGKLLDAVEAFREEARAALAEGEK